MNQPCISSESAIHQPRIRHASAVNHTTTSSSPDCSSCTSPDTRAVVLTAGLNSMPPNQVAPLAPITCPAHSAIPTATACFWKAFASACSASTLASVIWSCAQGCVHWLRCMRTLLQARTKKRYEHAEVAAKASCERCCGQKASFCVVMTAQIQRGQGEPKVAGSTTAVSHGQCCRGRGSGKESNLAGFKHGLQRFVRL
jgi:hypothetical protein